MWEGHRISGVCCYKYKCGGMDIGSKGRRRFSGVCCYKCGGMNIGTKGGIGFLGYVATSVVGGT